MAEPSFLRKDVLGYEADVRRAAPGPRTRHPPPCGGRRVLLRSQRQGQGDSGGHGGGRHPRHRHLHPTLSQAQHRKRRQRELRHGVRAQRPHTPVRVGRAPQGIVGSRVVIESRLFNA